DVSVGVPEAFGLDPLPHEGAHYAHAGQLLAQDPVDAVELALEGPEQGDHAADDPDRDHEEHGHGYRDDPAEPDVLAQRHDDPADRQQRSGHEHGRAH